MKLQLRFFLVFAVIFLAAASFLVLQQRFEVDRSQSVLTSELRQRKVYLQNIVSLDGRSEQTIAEDYSFWDDMVNFVKQDNVAFAHENLDTGLSTFNVDADWVYRPTGKLLYFSSADGTNTLRDLSLPAAYFAQLSKTKFSHFYMWDHGRLVEIRAATIVPTADPNHTTPAQGFLLIGRIIGRGYTQSMSTLSGSTIQLASASDTKDAIGSNSVAFGEVLPNWNGQASAVLRSTSTVSVIKDLTQQHERQLQVLSAFTAVSVIIIITMLWWLVLRPVATVNRAIRQQKPEMLEKLRGKHTEFGRLAQTVFEFFEQKVSLAEAEFKRGELEKLNKEKASFLAIAAHELNGPVTNVKLFAEFLAFLLTKAGDNKKAINTQVKRIEHQTTKINMLLNDLRAASTGKQALEFNHRDIDFDAFLREEVEEARFSVKNKINLVSDTHAMINSDPDRLGQVVTNLIRNATKYSPNNGDISIRAAARDGKIVVSVQDFGVGIPPDDVPHLFERFYRSSSVASSFPGLGLGLYVSKGIVEALGGTMWVESEVGKGSTFHFSLPLGQPNPAGPAQENDVSRPPMASSSPE